MGPGEFSGAWTLFSFGHCLSIRSPHGEDSRDAKTLGLLSDKSTVFLG